MTSINKQLFLDVLNRLDEELEKSHIVLMKQNNLKNLLPIHCYLLLAINYFENPPIIVDIAQKLYKSKAAVGAVIKTLEKRAYIKSMESTQDRRAKKIILTSKGKKAATIIQNMWDTHNLMALKNLNENEKSSLYKMLSKIEQNVRLFNDFNKIKV